MGSFRPGGFIVFPSKADYRYFDSIAPLDRRGHGIRNAKSAGH